VIADQEAEPPFRSQLAAPAEEIVRMHCNAGSQYLWWTEADMDAVTELSASNFRTMGVRTDVVDVSSPFHWLMAGTKMDPALRRLGAAMIPGGPGMSELRRRANLGPGWLAGIVGLPAIDGARRAGASWDLAAASR
jgi:hypothetical protein